MQRPWALWTDLLLTTAYFLSHIPLGHLSRGRGTAHSGLGPSTSVINQGNKRPIHRLCLLASLMGACSELRISFPDDSGLPS